MASVPNTEFWIEFIEIYKSYPEVWKIKSELYKNRVLKEKAFQCLLIKFKELEPNASMDLLKKKINNLRTCYRRELKRKLRSEKSGAGAENVYIPSVWYFEQLTFLKDQEVQVEGTSSISNEEDENFVVSDEETVSPSISKKMNTEKHLKIQRNDILLKAVQHLENSTKREDDASAFGFIWANKFRKLDPNQQTFASKAIMEVLYQGQLGKLDENSYKAFEGPNIYTPFSRTSSPSIYSGTSSPISPDGNAFQMQSTAQSPVHRKFTKTLPQNQYLTRPQPKPVRVIPFQPHSPDLVFESEYEETQAKPVKVIPYKLHNPDVVFTSKYEETQPKPVRVIPYQLQSPDVVFESEYEETQLQPSYRYDNVQDLFSDPEYT